MNIIERIYLRLLRAARRWVDRRLGPLEDLAEAERVVGLRERRGGFRDEDSPAAEETLRAYRVGGLP